MGWSGWPGADGTQDVQDFSWIGQMPRAIRDAAQMLGQKYWPPTSPAAFSGTISTLTDNGDGTITLADSSLSPVPAGHSDDGSWWNGLQRSSSDCTRGKYWVAVTCDSGASGGSPYLDGNYDLIIENTDRSSDWYRRIMPWQVCRIGAISNNTNSTLTFSATKLNDWIISKLSPSALADLVGANYIIVRSSGTWWHERWPDYPNDQELWIGSADSGAVYVDGTGYVQELHDSILRSPWDSHAEAANNWAVNQWAGKELLTYGGGSLRRLTISGNDADTLFVGGITSIPTSPPATSYAPDGDFSILASGGRGYPGRSSFPIARWYGGAPRAIIAHPPDSDTLTTYAKVAALDSDRWEELESLAGDVCGSDTSFVTPVALDVDLFVSQTNMCDGAARAGSSRAPDLYKSIRGWQVALEGMIGACVRPVDPVAELTADGLLPIYSRAQCFLDCGINAGTTTLQTETTGGGPDTDQYFTVPSQYYGQDIYYQVDDPAGVRRVADAIGTADAAGKVGVTSNNAAWAGGAVVYSAGWTRQFPREFTYLHPVDGYFMPDLDGGGAAVDPPVVSDFSTSGCTGVGSWLKRAASSGSRSYSHYGIVGNAADGFTAGALYRHVGDNWADGTLGFGDSGVGVTVPYTDHAYEGAHPKATQLQLRADRSFIITDASGYYLTDSSKHWWPEWFAGGTLITQSGTSLSATASSLTTDATRADASNAASCWFQSGRFVGFSSAYEGFTLEIDFDAGGGLKTYKRLITSTSVSGTSVVFHFAAVDSVAFTGALAWRLKEPKYKLNRWLGKRIRITKDDGTTMDVLAAANDDQTIFVTDLTGAGLEAPLQVGWTGEILEYETGSVWQFATTQPSDDRAWQKIAADQYWIQPVGTDPRSPGPTFHADGRENEPQPIISYGRLRHGDYVLKKVFDELYAVNNKLRWTRTGITWKASADDASPEENHGEGGSDIVCPNYGTALSQAQSRFGMFETVDGHPPEAQSTGDTTMDAGEVSGDCRLERWYAYADVSAINTLLSSTASIWTWAGITAGPFDDSTPTTNEADLERWHFDASGDSVTFHEWTHFTDLGPAATAERRSTRFGSNTRPDDPDDPRVPTLSAGEERFETTGYVVAASAAILKFDVTGGREFIA